MTDDFKRSQFGNTRLDKRALQISRALSAKPEDSLPEAIGDDQELQNTYRFLGHDWLSFEDLTRPHFEATAQRCHLIGDDISVIHDTTEYAFPIHNDKMRKDLSRLSSRRQGFFGHGSLAVAPGPVACPLGYLAYQPFVHINDLPDASAQAFWQERNGVMEHELKRWMRGVYQAQQQLGPKVSPLNIFDSEGDAYEILVDMHEGQHRYLIRLGQNRRVVGPDGSRGLLHDVMATQPVIDTRTVQVSARKPTGPPRSRKPKRSARVTTMEVRAATLEIIRPDSDNALDSWPKAIKTNVVYLRERQPPQGEEPIEWYLVTTEPIDSAEQVEAIIIRYQDRWLIEESNKSIKTGCAYTKRQLESATSLLNALAITLPVSLDLLRFRYLSRAAPHWPAEVVVTKRHLRILQSVVEKVKWSEEPTVEEATLAVAKLGGFLKHNKWPGWQTLSRGYQTLLDYEVGWVAAQRTRDSPG